MASTFMHRPASGIDWRPPPLAGLRRVRYGWAYGRPQVAGYVEAWGGVRTSKFDQVCEVCWSSIPRFQPVSKTGQRGVKAYFEARLGLWRHYECHQWQVNGGEWKMPRGIVGAHKTRLARRGAVGSAA